MFDFYKNIKSYVKPGVIHTDNNIFRLHYRVTVVLLVGFSVLLTSNQLFGEPINCDVEQRKEVADTICWITGSFTIEDTSSDLQLPGLGQPDYRNPRSSHRIYKQNYYQWVCIIFAIQAVLFYSPRYFWKICEGGRLKILIGEFGGPLTSEKWNSVAKDRFVKNILDRSYIHNFYTSRYCICEILNLLNVLGNIYLTDWFLNGKFCTYGIAYATYKQVNPMNTIFPKLAKCVFYRYGASGDKEIRDALCVLPLNVLNEKVFLILWYWFIILIVFSSLCVIYRVLLLCFPSFRMYLLRAQARKLGRKKAKLIINKLSFGDFFILHKISKNVNPFLFQELVFCLYDHLDTRGSYKNFIQDV